MEPQNNNIPLPTPAPDGIHPMSDSTTKKINIKTILLGLIVLILVSVGLYFLLSNKSSKPVPDTIAQDVLPSIPAIAVLSETQRIEQLNMLWKDFSYQGRPIHPTCFSKLFSMGDETRPESVKLSSCSTYNEEKQRKEGKLENSADFLIYNDFVQGVQYNGADIYTIVAKHGDVYYVQYTQNTGGTGYFSNIVSVFKKGDTLTDAQIVTDGGDRCNGGVNGVIAPAGATSFYYSNDLTPIDILTASGKDTSLFKPYEDLEASATSCFGKLYMKYDMDTKQSTMQYVDIDLDSYTEDQEGWTDQYVYQTCFNKVYNSYIKKGEVRLDVPRLNNFYDDFVHTCVPNTPNKQTFKTIINTNTMNNEPAITLTSDEKLIVEAIQNLRTIGINKDGQALLDYTKKPFELIGNDKDPHFVELLAGLKESMNNPKIKFWNIVQAMSGGLTPEAINSQMDQCKFREKSEGFPPKLERTASCSFTYLVDPALIGSTDKSPISVTYKISFLKISGTWYVDISGLDFFGFISKMNFTNI